MHIQNRHRHFVLLPLVAALALAAFGMRGDVPARGDVLGPAVGGDSRAFIAEGVEVVPEADTVMRWQEDLQVDVGSVLVGSDGRIVLQAGPATITAFHAAAYVSASPDNVTVAALSGPVVVRVGESRIVVPTGLQTDIPADRTPDMEEQAYQPLPDGFALAQVKRLGSLGDPRADRTSYTRPFLASVPFLQLPQARARAQRAYQQGLIHDIAVAAAAGDGSRVHAFLLQVDQTVYTSVADWSDALAAAVGHPSIIAEILPQVPSADLQLLAFFHPDLRLAAWAQDLTARRETLVRPALLLLPLDDQGGTALPPFVVERWTLDVEQYLQDKTDPGVFLSPMLWRMEPVRKAAVSRGFPERLQRYADAVERIAKPYADLLSPHAAGLVEAWRTAKAAATSVGDQPVAVEPERPADAPAVASSSAPALSDAEIQHLVQDARGSLLSAGALLTMDATIHAVSAGRVEISGVVVASPTGDHDYAFAYDPQTKNVSAIVRDGSGFPYELPFEAFMAWAKSGE
jgi:hypothetical protein